MKIIAILFVWSAAALSGFARAQSDINLSGYTLSFDDEFDTLSLTSASPKGASTWFFWPPYGAAGGYSESTWATSAFSVNSGILSDTASEVGSTWSSGNLSSMDPTGAGFGQQYGYFEIRAQMPSSGTGAWPAFWLSSQNSILNNDHGTSLPNEEIDIFEWYGTCYTNNQAVIQQASHNWVPSGGPAGLYSPTTPMPGGAFPWQGYHIYGCQVDPIHVTWYIDGVQTNQIATPTAYITSPFYIMVDYALGGGWPLTGMVNNSSLSVDWVRVYQLPAYPVIVSSTAANGTVNTPFSYQVTAYNSPTSYRASGLPPGLSLNTTTGAISGTPTATGTSTATLSATNASGTGTATLTLTISGVAMGLDFSGGGTAIPATTSAGVLPKLNWNNLANDAPGSLSTIVDSTGAVVSGSGAAWTSHSGGSNTLHAFGDKFPSTGDIDLFSSSWEVYSATPGANTPWGGAFTVTGIPYSTYDVYVYTEGVAGQAGLINLNGTFPADGDPTGGTTFEFTELGNTMNSYIAATGAGGANYAVFPGIEGSSVVANARAAGSNGGIVGVQIVDTSAPALSSSTSASGQVYSPFSYQITASNTPTSFHATGLPSGLMVNTTTGAITGTPAASAAGTSTVILTAANAYGTGSATLSLTIAAAPPEPIGLDFSGHGTPIPAGTSAGVVAQTNWNNLNTAAPGSLTTVVDSTGQTIPGLGASWTSHSKGKNALFTFSGGFSTTGDKDLFSSSWRVYGAAPGAKTAWGGIFIVSGIPFSTYDVYVYTEGKTGQAALINLNGAFPKDGDPVGGTTFDLTQLGKAMKTYVVATGAAGGANYVLFTNVTGTTVTINARAGAGNGGVVGIQVVPVSP